MFSRLAFFALFAAASALAHSLGHGPAIAGKGPGGGSLSAVILAKDAELGAEAPARAIAEWKVGPASVEVTLWKEDRKTAIVIPAGAELKWIVVGKKLGKPIVLKTTAPVTGALRQEFDPSALAKAEALELILPSLATSTEKHVAAHGL